ECWGGCKIRAREKEQWRHGQDCSQKQQYAPSVWSPLLPSGATRTEKAQVTALPLGPAEIIFYTSGVIFHSLVNNKFHAIFRDSNSHQLRRHECSYLSEKLPFPFPFCSWQIPPFGPSAVQP
uniref:Uncharacterized protein n=1 Tax=Amazona collaria TaxID=241587 RepID=A0A8B9FUB3_9PSIT